MKLDRGDELIWLAKLGDFILPLPNFRWRREALALHDENHAETGYGFSAAEECRLATWELASGCYASIYAKGLCAGLMIIGLAFGPADIFRAYRRGGQARACRDIQGG